MAAPAPAGLIRYLQACGGSDTFEFSDAQGQPDLLAARRLAEDLRGRLGDQLGVTATVSQAVNRVTISLVLENAHI